MMSDAEQSEGQSNSRTESASSGAYEALRRNFRNLDNVERYGVNNKKLARRVLKKSKNADLYVVLNLDRHGHVLRVPGYCDESETQERK